MVFHIGYTIALELLLVKEKLRRDHDKLSMNWYFWKSKTRLCLLLIVSCIL